MSDSQVGKKNAAVDDLYDEAEYWHVNTGGETIRTPNGFPVNGASSSGGPRRCG